MGIRFRKRIKILPGVHLNLSRSGVSTSLGVPGASITKGHGQTRTNLGIPGSGISHNTVAVDTPKRSAPDAPAAGPGTSAKIANAAGSFLAGALLGLMTVIVKAIFSPPKRGRRRR